MPDLVERAEDIEAEAWSELYRRAPQELRSALGLEVARQRGVTLLSASKADHLLLNRAIGLGRATDSEEAATEMVVEHYARRDIERYWIHLGSRLRSSSFPTHLQSRRVLPYPRSWMKFARRSAPVAAARSDLCVRPARPDDATPIAQITAAGFEMPEEAGALFATAIGARGWYYYVVEQEDQVVSASALYALGRDALLVFAATASNARRKGCQRALMAARLERARELGCDHAFTETGVPVEGEAGSSYRNILRAGFDELYVRDNFAPEGTRWHQHPSSDANARSAVSLEPSKTRRRGAAPSGT